MGRLSGVRVKLDECVSKLGAAVDEKPFLPSKAKALETAVETYRDLLRAENDAKTQALESENIELKERLRPFEGLNLEEIGSVKDELRTTKAQLENTRNSNNSYSREAVTAKGEIENLKSILRWMCEQVSSEARLKIAVSAFLKFHAKAVPIIDCLYPLGTCKEFVRISYSKQSLIDTVRTRQHSTDSDDILPVQFATLYAREKHQLDIPELLKAQAAENFRKSQDEDRRRGEEQRAREAAAFRSMRSNAQEEMIQRAEYGLTPVVHVDPSDRW